jgi:hypothetical protein
VTATDSTETVSRNHVPLIPTPMPGFSLRSTTAKSAAYARTAQTTMLNHHRTLVRPTQPWIVVDAPARMLVAATIVRNAKPFE